MTKRLFDAGGPRDRSVGAAEPAQRIAGPAELLQAVPYLLGFHPARSLVLVGLRDGMLVVTARMDLADADADADADGGPLPGTLASICGGGATELIAVVYSDDELSHRHGDDGAGRDLPWAHLADRLAELVDTLPCRVHDVLLVSGEQWWSFACDSARCCPSAGRPLPAAPSPFATKATVDGVMPLPDRAAFAALLDPLPEPDRQRLQPLVAHAENAAVAATLAAGSTRHERAIKRALFATARASAQPRWCPPGDAEAARFAAALATTSVRDAVWLAIDSRRLDGRPLWRELARRVPAPYDAPALFLYGWASWRAGDGALAGIAGDRAIASDPGYAAADLLLAALSQGIDPRRFPRLNRSA